MDAEEKILSLLRERKEEGTLQSEMPEILNLSKSTVSEILSRLEEEGRILRKKVTSKSYRVWLLPYSPQPVEGIVRVGILRASEYAVVVNAAKKIGAAIRVYDSGLDLTRALVSGSVDVAASPLVSQVFFGILMKNISIVRIVAMNGSGIVFGGGKEFFGCSEFSTMERNLRRYMRIRGMEERIRYFSSPKAMVDAIDELRGIAIWEPYLTEMSGDHGIEMFDEVLGDFVCCTLAYNVEFSKKNPELLDAFLDRFDSGGKDVETLAELTGFDVNLVRRSIKRYNLNPPQKRDILDRELDFLSLGSIDDIVKM